MSGRADESRPIDDSTSGLGDRALGYLLLATGLAGFLAAFTLAVEKFLLLTNPLYVPSCTVSEVLSCGSVMTSDQAELFGFPNPLLGIAGFSVLLASGAVVLSGGRLTKPYWIGLQIGLTAAVVFVSWLIFQTLYRIGAICPYCSVVWASTIPAFWYVTLHNLRYAPRGWWSGLADFSQRNHGIILTLWILVIVAMMYDSFWAPW